MTRRAFVNEYERSVRIAYKKHLAQLGFSLRKDRPTGELVAESSACRVWFNPGAFLPCVERIPRTPQDAYAIYHLNTLLEAGGCDEFNLCPFTGRVPPIRAEVDRMVSLLVEQCRPALDGEDEAWRNLDSLVAEKENEAIARLDEVGLQLKDGDRWRELPELESVKVKAASKPVNVLLTLLLLAVPGGYTIFLAVIYCIALFGPPQKDTLEMVLAFSAFGVPMILLDIWIVRRVLLCDYYWETGRDGLEIGKLFGKRLVPWREIDWINCIRGRGFAFRTSEGVSRLEKRASSDTFLEASVWQHMKRVGRGFVSPPSPLAVSLWARIPRESADEVQWEMPHPQYVIDLTLRFLAWEALIWGLAIELKLVWLPLVYIFAIYPAMIALIRLTLIRRVSVHSDRIEATTALGSSVIQWKSVRSVKFLGHALMVRTGVLGYVTIPWDAKHPNSTRVILMIVRRLRQEERFRLLPFPVMLLISAYGGQDDEMYI